jgi:hypothetical protein
MNEPRRHSGDDIVDRETLLAYLRQYPGDKFEESKLKAATGVNKAIIRRLLRDVPGIDQELLERGKVCWKGGNPDAGSEETP